MHWIQAIGWYFAASVFVPLLVFFLVAGVTRYFGGDQIIELPKITVLLLAVAIIGACAGFSGGMSRVGVVGAIVPAMFTLLGGMAVYLFGVDTTRGLNVSLTTGCLALALFISYAVGSQLRYTGDEFREIRARCLSVYSNADLLSQPDALAAFERRYEGICDQTRFWTLR